MEEKIKNKEAVRIIKEIKDDTKETIKEEFKEEMSQEAKDNKQEPKIEEPSENSEGGYQNKKQGLISPPKEGDVCIIQ